VSESTERICTSNSGFGWTLRLRLPPEAEPAQAPIPTRTRTPPPAEHIEQRIADLALCRDRFPVLFDAVRPRPLAIGVDKQLAELIGADRAGCLLDWWTQWPAYIAAVAAGGRRFHLDGTEAGEISDEHRRFAAGKSSSRGVP
jgi:hypothetical protein